LSNASYDVFEVSATIQCKIFCISISYLKTLRLYITRGTISLPDVLYWYEAWSLTLKEKPMLRSFENKVLVKTWGPRREEVAGGWRQLCNEEFYNLFPS